MTVYTVNRTVRRAVATLLMAGVAWMFGAGTATGGGLGPVQGSPDNGSDVIFDAPCLQGWVDISGNSTPFFPNGEGLVLVALQDSVFLFRLIAFQAGLHQSHQAVWFDSKDRFFPKEVQNKKRGKDSDKIERNQVPISIAC